MNIELAVCGSLSAFSLQHLDSRVFPEDLLCA